jgi:hypothetical protein
MSSEEFSEFQVFMNAEQMLPVHDRGRHADQLAAQANGPLRRGKGAALWARADFVAADPWAGIATRTGGAKGKQKPKASAQDVLAGVNQLRKKRGA